MKNLYHKKGYIQQVFETLGGIVGLVLEIILGFFLIISKLLWRFRRWEYRFAIAFLVIMGAYSTFKFWAYAPKAQAMIAPYVVGQPLTEHQQIVNYIEEVFGPDAPKAFTLLNCENHALNPLAINDNRTWGGVGQDVGVMQINTIYQGVSVRYLENWKVNIQIGYQIYQASGNHFNLWTCGKELGI